MGRPRNAPAVLAKRRAIDSEVYNTLLANPDGLLRTEIAKRLAISEKDVFNSVLRLETAGKSRRADVGSGLYIVKAKGV